LAGRYQCIRVEESADFGIVISGLEIIQLRLGVVVEATSAFFAPSTSTSLAAVWCFNTANYSPLYIIKRENSKKCNINTAQKIKSFLCSIFVSYFDFMSFI
jgi:hypothetical protein